jgi:Na+:H+ antiporter, NhaA family
MKATLASIPSRASSALHAFFRYEAAGGIVLVVAAAVALLLANSPLARHYDALFATPIDVSVGVLQIGKPLLLWINDGLMAVFFLLVALEIKREAVCGQLSSRAQLVLPLACAAGGVALPAAIFVAFNHGDAVAMRGWAIPTATDIAFALGVLSLLGSRAPLSLKVLLSAIAVIDDLAAIVIIAMFYTDNLSTLALVGAGAALMTLIVLNRSGVKRIAPYLLIGIVMWIFVLKSGVHATLAGVATGLLIPMGDPEDAHDSPLERLEHGLHPWVAFAILPLFAFANAGLSLAGIGVSQLVHPVPMGVALGLLLGKPAGVFGAAWLCIASGIGRRPDGASWTALFGMALLCGIGFTMSLFIGSLAFDHAAASIAASSRLGILLGSIVSAIGGFALLWFTLPRASAR